MSIAWLAPAALAGLALVAIPIVIHLLVIDRRRRLLFPSLRFLQESRQSALRSRALRDPLLLLCRILIVWVAILALAGPILRTPSRDAAHARRIVRAIVVEAGFPDSSIAPELSSAFAGRVFSRAVMADAIAEGLQWMAGQPAAARELVIVGAFRRGQFDRVDLRDVPEPVGIRLVPVPAPPLPRVIEFPVLKMLDGTIRLERHRVELADDATSVRVGEAASLAASPIAIIAAASDQPLADAALRAVLGEGVRWPERATDRKLLIVWQSANQSDVERASPGATVIQMSVPSPASTAAAAVAEAIANDVRAPADALEPVAIPLDELANWTRAPGLPPADAAPSDEGDRRWLWLAALVLLASEHWLRRVSIVRVHPDLTVEEPRVA